VSASAVGVGVGIPWTNTGGTVTFQDGHLPTVTRGILRLIQILDILAIALAVTFAVRLFRTSGWSKIFGM
jgi:hypothetical protein